MYAYLYDNVEDPKRNNNYNEDGCGYCNHYHGTDDTEQDADKCSARLCVWACVCVCVCMCIYILHEHVKYTCTCTCVHPYRTDLGIASSIT